MKAIYFFSKRCLVARIRMLCNHPFLSTTHTIQLRVYISFVDQIQCKYKIFNFFLQTQLPNLWHKPHAYKKFDHIPKRINCEFMVAKFHHFNQQSMVCVHLFITNFPCFASLQDIFRTRFRPIKLFTVFRSMGCGKKPLK